MEQSVKLYFTADANKVLDTIFEQIKNRQQKVASSCEVDGKILIGRDFDRAAINNFAAKHKAVMVI